MPQFSARLTKLLLIRGVARALAPIAILWGIYDWYMFDRLAVPPRFPMYALLYAALTGNYVLVYILGWVAPTTINGPWRVRPWQTLVLLVNAFFLPIQYYRHCSYLPWGFIVITLLFIVGLYVSTAIWFHLQEKLPMGRAFAFRKAAAQSATVPLAQPAEAGRP